MGDIRSRHATQEYRDNYDRIFRKEAAAVETDPPTLCIACNLPGTEENPILIGHLHKACHEHIRKVPRREEF